MRRRTALLIAAAGLSLLRCASSPPSVPRRQVERAIELSDGQTVRYLLYEPSGKRTDPRLPLILFLHGAGERGDDLDLVRREGLPRLIDSLERFPFIVVAPQIRTKRWNVGFLEPFLEEVVRRHEADADRVAATGLSTGAVAALDLAIAHPDLLAAVVAVTPDRVPDRLCRLSRVPVWIFQNARDVRVPPRHARRIARQIADCGGSARLTMFPSAGHDAWSDAYVYPGLYEWLRAQKKPPR